MFGIEGAVNRRDWDNRPEEGWYRDQCITVKQAVHAFTTGAAYANYEENEKGTIEVGKFADLIVLSDDIFTMDKNDLAKASVEKTIIGGKLVYSI